MQKQGVPMGSPLSPILADIIMEDLLEEVFKNLSDKPKFVVKYVDDLFAILKINNVNSTLHALNSYHQNIQFTVEIEENGKLPYLDVLVIKNQNHFIFDWYKKPTSSGRLINFNSKHPKQIIINTAKNFINRVLDNSDSSFIQKNIKIISETLSANSFPIQITKSLIANYNNGRTTPGNVDGGQQRIYRSSIYVPQLSERLTNAPIRDKERIKIAFKSSNTLKTNVFTKLKDETKKEDKSDVVYQITCLGGNNTCSKVYIGTSKQKLKNRISGHKSDVRTGNSQKTALAMHCLEEDHRPDFDNVKILQQENHYSKRMLLEMLHIQKNENVVNRRSDCDGLSIIYSHLAKS
ncbi:uncharacterized protein LOC129911064 [Episyrphus balteatus]|uniref:uncharacterized protein LOC129911064 n=1 Tax=Episyrphus balteatus TaxID=286459 RepID=UPI002485F1E8|nr:uncharacterized protein LOC129911064 [Episyrphus balteatus]